MKTIKNTDRKQILKVKKLMDFNQREEVKQLLSN
jgi:hypothetical protein